MDVQIECICPPKDGQAQHDHDTITLLDILDFRRTLTIRQEIRFAQAMALEAGQSLSVAEMTAVMAEAYIVNCIGAWTVCDERGKPLPLSKANVQKHLLTNYEAAEDVGDAADSLYSEKVVLPLMGRASNSSPATPTPDSTSPKTPGSKTRTRSKPSKPSSTSTSPMAVTGPMAASPGGVSNSSLS